MSSSRNSSWRGAALALLVAVSFATNSAFAGLAYTGGTNALSVFAVRSTAAFVILAAVLYFTGRSLSIPREQRLLAFGLGLVMAGASYGLLGAMEMMPVALCVITLYTYPLIVAAVAWVSGREPFRWPFAVALLCAFVGLVLALDLSGEAPHFLGIGLASCAAMGVAALLIVNERQHASEGSLAFTLHMLGTCMLVSLGATLALDAFALPQSTAGWVGFIGTPLSYSFAIIFMFVAVSMIGSVRASLFMNLEPVSSVLLGYLLLAQSLNLLQLFGIALVIAAILAVEGFKSGVGVALNSAD